MAWNLDTARAYLKMPDNSKDAVIQQTMDYVVAAVESMLVRGLFRRRMTVIFREPCARVLLLGHYPLHKVYSVMHADGTALGQNWSTHCRGGMIYLNAAVCGSKDIAVDYEGGWDQVPLDLERAMWEIFHVAWAGTDEDTGGPSASGGTTVVQGSGDVKSMTVFDGFKIDYDVGTTVSDSNDALASQQAEWGWLSPWASVLENYRSENGAGGLGVA